MEDERIIGLYFARDEQALAETDRKYGSYCRAIAERILKNRQDTEECVQDTWLRAWNAIPPDRPSVLSAFLGRITRNLSLDRYDALHTKKRGGGAVEAPLEELGDCLAGAQSPELALEAKELSQAIDRFLRTLPERERNIFLRRYWYLDSVTDIAARFDLRVNTVKSILLRTREKLRRELRKEGAAV